MKKLIMVALAVFGIGLANAQYTSSRIIHSWTWNGFEHIVFESGGHWYLEVRFRTSGGVSVIHYESCPCKSRH